MLLVHFAFHKTSPAGIEPTLLAPEANALSAELRGQYFFNLTWSSALRQDGIVEGVYPDLGAVFWIGAEGEM